MNPRNGPSQASAFTLIEAIAVIVLLAIAVPGMIWALRDAQVKRADPVMVSRAQWLAAERLETIIADRQSDARGYSYIIASNYPPETIISGFPGFTRSVAIVNTQADLTTSGNGYKRATVTTTYRSSSGQSRSLTLSTVLTDY